LIAGVATAVKGLSPATRVLGVEPAAAADAKMSLEAGRIVHLKAPPETVADGVRTLAVGERPFEVMKARVDGILAVSEEAILEAQRLILSRLKLVAEPTGALPLAAVLERGAALPGRLALVVSGGNWLPV
jgi:threonine dehydratase